MPLGGSLAGMARVVLRADTAGYTRDMQQAERTFRRTTDDMNRHVSSLSRGALAGSGIFHGFARSIAFASGAFLGGAGLTFAIKSAINSASDLNEQMNKVNVVFGDSAAGVRAWANDSATAMGVSRREALASAGTFGNLFRAMGFAGDATVGMSKGLVQLSADLASFNNAAPLDTLQALRSGLAGEIEPLRRYGIFLSQSRVQHELLSVGIKTTYQNITAAQKAWASYRIIMRDSAATQGDFGRTSNQLANQQRILKAQIDNTMASLGKALLPTVLKVVTAMNKWLGSTENQQQLQKDFTATIRGVTKAVNSLVAAVEGIAKAYRAFDDFLTGLQKWGDEVDRVSKQIGTNLALNILEPFSHLPRELGKWAREAKKELVNAAGSSPEATSPEFTQNPAGAGQTGIAIANKAVEIGANRNRVYVWGGTTAEVGYDCSGFVYDMYKRQGISIPRTTDTQFYDPRALNIALADLRAGDAVYFIGSNTGANAGRPPRHCGIYIGSGNFIEYFSGGKPAKIAPLRSRGDYMGARRWLKIKSSSGGGERSTPAATPASAGAPPPSAPTKPRATKDQPLVPLGLETRLAKAEAENNQKEELAAHKAIRDYLVVAIHHTTDQQKLLDLWRRLREERDAIAGKKPDKKKGDVVTQLDVLQERIDLARLTPRLTDDLTALKAMEDYLEKRIATTKRIRKNAKVLSELESALAGVKGQIADLQPKAKEKPIGLGIPALAGVLGEFEKLRGGVAPISITVDGLGKILYPGAPTLGSWDRVIDLLKKKLRAALARQAVLQRNLRVAQRAKRPNKKHIANIRQALQKVNQVVAELRSDIGEALAARNELALEISSDIQRQAEENEQARERADQEAADLARGAAEEQARAAEASAAQAEEAARTQAAQAEQAAQAQVQAAAAYEAGLLEAPADLRLALARAQGTPDTADDLGILQSMRSLFASRVAMTQNIETQISLQNELNSLDSQIANLMQQRVDGVDAELKRQQDIDRQVVAYLAAQRELVRSYGQTLIRGSMAGSPISVQNYFASGPQDPHLYSANIAFELRALVG